MVEYSKYLSRKDVFDIPPLIVVGITNTDRNRDLTPSHSNIDYSGKPDTTLTGFDLSIINGNLSLNKSSKSSWIRILLKYFPMDDGGSSSGFYV